MLVVYQCLANAQWQNQMDLYTWQDGLSFGKGPSHIKRAAQSGNNKANRAKPDAVRSGWPVGCNGFKGAAKSNCMAFGL